MKFNKSPYKLLIIVVSLLTTNTAFAQTKYLDKVANIKKDLYGNAVWRNVVYKTMTSDDMLRCTMNGIAVMTSEVKGAKFQDAVISNAAFMQIASLVYKEEMGITENIFGKMLRPHLEEYKYGDYDNLLLTNYKYCALVGEKIVITYVKVDKK